MKIEIGGGGSPIPGYVNCDIRDAPQVKYVIKDNKLPFDAASIDEILSIHCLEHLTREDGEQMLTECCRILKPGHVLILAIPCLDMIAKSFMRNQHTAFKHIFGTDAFTENRHQTFWTRAELKAAILNAGFANVVEEPFGWPQKHVADWTAQLRATA